MYSYTKEEKMNPKKTAVVHTNKQSNWLSSKMWLKFNYVVKLLVFFATSALFLTVIPNNNIVKADIVIPPGGQQITVTRGVGPYWVSYNTSSSITATSATNIRVFFGASLGVVDRNWYMADRVRIWVDGALVKDYITVRTNQNVQTSYTTQGVDHIDDITVSAGPHTVEARIYAVQWSNSQFVYQSDSGVPAAGGDDNNCGSTDVCYGRLGPTVVNPCTPLAPQTQTIACPAGQTGTVTQQRTSSCPGPTWSGWSTISSSCATPGATISTSPASGWAPATTTINWSTSSLPAGTTCTNNWNSFMPINPNTSGSDTRTLAAGTYTFTISCSNGTSASTVFTSNQLPPPTITFVSSTCDYSNPRVTLRLTAPASVPWGMWINLYIYNGGSLAYQVYLNPGQSVDIPSQNFYSGYSALSPNGYSTFYANTNVAGLTTSGYSSLPVWIPNCPSPPIISSATPACNPGPSYTPYNSIGYQYSTYGNPTSYHLDRLSGQAFTVHGQGYIGTYGPGSNPILDGGVVNNTSYSYRMRADNGSFQSTPSNVSTITSNNCTPPTLSATSTCPNNSTTPLITLTMTAPANAGRDMWNSLYLSGFGKLNDTYLSPSQAATIASTSFPVGAQTIANNTTYNFNANSWMPGFSNSPSRNASITTQDCSLPRTFTISTNTAPGNICPAEGLPKLSVNISKSANATRYEVHTYERDGSNNYTIPVPAGRVNYTSNDLFPGVPITSNVGSATRTFDMAPNKFYGVYVIAFNGPLATSSYIYSNMASANTAPTAAAWAFMNASWCDTTSPTIQLASLVQCFQPNQLPANIDLTIADNPGNGAPISSVSGVNPTSIRFILNEFGIPAVTQEFNHQSVDNNIYRKSFTAADFFAGIDKDYELSARACDFRGNCSIMNKVTVSYAQVCGAWIQTRQGNVHSEKEINAPGGPQ